jgi:hypothetical protein
MEHHMKVSQARRVFLATVSLAGLIGLGASGPAFAGSRTTTTNRVPTSTTIAAPAVAGVYGERTITIVYLPTRRGVEVQTELVSGPTPSSINQLGSITQITGAAQSTAYVFRVRSHQFYDDRTGQATNLFSSWVNVSYTTPVFSIVNPPTNLRIVSVASGQVEITFDAPVPTTASQTSFSYQLSVDGGAYSNTCTDSYSPYCGTVGASVSHTPGTTTRVNVVAFDPNGNRSVASATLTITN